MIAIAGKRMRIGAILEDIALFVYFLTISGEMLNITVGIFKPRISHVVSLILLLFFFKIKKMISVDKALFSPFLLLFISISISCLFSADSLRSIGYLLVFSFNFVCYFLLPYNFFMIFEKKRVLKIYFSSFIVIGLFAVLQLVFSLKGVILPFVTQYANDMARGQGWSYEPSFYALYMTSFVMFYNGLVLYKTDRRVNWFYFAVVNVFLIASTSTGIIFSYPIFALCYLISGYSCVTREYVRKVKRKTAQILVFFLGSMALIWFILPVQFVTTFYKFFNLGFTKHWSITIRWKGALDCLEIFMNNPLFGVGIGGVGPYLYSAFENGSKAVTLKEIELYDPTMVFPEILASLGIFGLFAFAFLFYRFWNIFKAVMDKSLPISLEERRTAIALMISLVCTIFVLQFNQGIFRSYIWLHGALVLGYFRSLTRV